MAAVAGVGVAGGDVGVGTGVGVEVVPLVPPPPQETSRTARIRLHKAIVVPRDTCCNRINMIIFILLYIGFSFIIVYLQAYKRSRSWMTGQGDAQMSLRGYSLLYENILLLI